MRAIAEARRSTPEDLSFVAFRHAAASFPFSWHYHPDFELTLIEAGAGTRFVGDSIAPFSAGDLVLIGGNLPHTWSSEGRVSGKRSHRAVVVHFPADGFSLNTPEFQGIRRLLALASRGCVFPAKLVARAAPAIRQLPALRGFEAWSQLAGLLHLLASHAEPVLLASSGYTPAVRQGARRRLERALAYIEAEAHSEALGLRAVARTVHLSPAAFSRFFRQMTGTTLIKHISQLRVGRACRLLSDTDQSVTEIAYTCGFRNLSNFNRRFRTIKRMTPTVYRNHFRAH